MVFSLPLNVYKAYEVAFDIIVDNVITLKSADTADSV
jgi:hypothetical protein